MLDIFFSNTDSRRNHCDSRKNIWLHAVQSKYVRSQHGTDLFLGFRVTERTSNAKHSRFHCAHGFAYLATTTSGKETTNKNAINGINNCAANENANDFYLPQNWWQYLKQTTVSRHIAHVLTLVVIWFFHSGIAVFPLASHLSHKSFLRWCDIALHAFWLVFHRSFERRAQMNWCASIHLRVWQLVPIMSIGWRSWMLFAGHTYSNQIQRRIFHRWCYGLTVIVGQSINSTISLDPFMNRIRFIYYEFMQCGSRASAAYTHTTQSPPDLFTQDPANLEFGLFIAAPCASLLLSWCFFMANCR